MYNGAEHREKEGTSLYFETTYTIDSRDLDCFNVCRPSALLGYLQDAAGLAAGQFGCTNMEMVDKYRHCWMVLRAGYTLERPLRWGDQLTIKTWHRGGEKPLMYRDFDLSVGGEPVGQAVSIWALVDLADHSLTRPDHFPEFAGTDGGPLIREVKLPKLKLPGPLAPVQTRTLHYSDTDGNGHVNNTRYADFLCDAAEFQTQPPGAFVRALHIDFLRECKAGESLSLLLRREGERAYVQGLDGAGEARFQGYLQA